MRAALLRRSSLGGLRGEGPPLLQGRPSANASRTDFPSDFPSGFAFKLAFKLAFKSRRLSLCNTVHGFYHVPVAPYTTLDDCTLLIYVLNTQTVLDSLETSLNGAGNHFLRHKDVSKGDHGASQPL